MGAPPVKLNLDKYTKTKSTGVPQQPQTIQNNTGIDIRPYIAATIRGLSGLSPGGWPGAIVGGLGELGAQTVEDRPNYNFPQVGAQAALGAIPFGKAGSIFKGVMKGAAMGGGGAALTQQAEQGLHIPTLQDVEGIGIGTVLGGVGGGITAKLDLGKYLSKEKPIASHAIVPDVPVITPKSTATKAGAERIRTSDPAIGKEILAQIESSKPQVSLQDVKKPVFETNKTENIIGALNAPKALAASMDLSAPMRQGIFLVGRKAWWTAWKPMIKSLREANYNQINAEIAAHPRFEEAMKNGLMLTTAENIGTREEQFASKLAEHIPGVKASERAYSTFLNKLRLDLYNDLVSKAERLGVPVEKAKLANYINAGSGRGTMSLTIGSRGHASRTLEAAAPFLNTTFFSPRFIASRIQLLNPVTYVKLDPFTRKEALRDLATLTSVASSALGLAKFNGAEVTMDPTSTDFGKIKVGDIRTDMLGGFGQYIRFYSQIVNGLATEDKGPDPFRFIQSKLSPTARMATEIASGKDYFGKDISIPKSVINNMAPMITRDIYELAKEDPDLIPLAGLSVVGLPVQSYGETSSGPKGSKSGMPEFKLPRMPR